jgi:chitin synthase
VAFWLLTNGALTVAIENVNGVNTGLTNSQIEQQQSSKQSTYFKIILWATFGLSLFRFVGCLIYWVKRNTTRCFRKT